MDFKPYQHRACLACGKRIPRWTNGQPTPTRKRFCGAACAAFYRRSMRGRGVAVGAKKTPEKWALLESVCATEDRREYAPCRACGRPCRLEPGQETFCNERCRDYVPLPDPLIPRPKTCGGAPLNLIGGHDWAGAVPVASTVINTIIQVEIAAPLQRIVISTLTANRVPA